MNRQQRTSPIIIHIAFHIEFCHHLIYNISCKTLRLSIYSISSWIQSPYYTYLILSQYTEFHIEFWEGCHIELWTNIQHSIYDFTEKFEPIYSIYYGILLLVHKKIFQKYFRDILRHEIPNSHLGSQQALTRIYR